MRAMPIQSERIHRITSGNWCCSAGISVTFADRAEEPRPVELPDPVEFLAVDRDAVAREPPAFPCREAGVFRSPAREEPLEVRVAIRATLPPLARKPADLHALQANSQGCKSAGKCRTRLTRPRAQQVRSSACGGASAPPRFRWCGEQPAAAGAACGPGCS